MLSESDIALYAFQKYGDTALQAAFCCLGSRADAEDVTQEVFFALHRAPRAFNDDEHLKAYILRAVINRCRNLRHLRNGTVNGGLSCGGKLRNAACGTCRGIRLVFKAVQAFSHVLDVRERTVNCFALLAGVAGHG